MNHRYLLIFFTLFTFLMVTVISFNRFIDPYGFYKQPRIFNINKDKPAFEKNIRMTKAFAIKDQKPDGTILGKFKGRVWFRSCNYLNNKNFYNLALPGLNIYELYRYFQHACY